MKRAKEAGIRLLNQGVSGTLEEGMLLSGLLAQYRAAGDRDCRETVLACMDKSVPRDAGESPILAGESPWQAAAFGNALFFALDETGEDRYKKALDAVASRVKEAALPETPAGLYAAAPFLAEYDTRFGDKQSYKLIADQFRAVHQAHFDRETGLYRSAGGVFSAREEGFMRLALADTAEKLDMMIYEHYRTLADLFLEAVRTTYQKGTEWACFRSGESEEQARDLSGYALSVTAVLKGIRLQLLDEERYLPRAMFAKANLEALYAAGLPCDAGAWLLEQSEGRRVSK